MSAPVLASIAFMRRRLPPGLYVWICERLYDQGAPVYDVVASLVSGGRWRSWGLAVTSGLRGQVVEIGPGPGHVLAALRRRGVRAIGVELSPAMTSRAARRAPGAVARGDGRRLPLRDACVDVLLLIFPAPYVLDPAFWREATRVLRPGGRVRVLLEVGGATLPSRTERLAAVAPELTVRPARVRIGDVSLGLYLARKRQYRRDLSAGLVRSQGGP